MLMRPIRDSRFDITGLYWIEAFTVQATFGDVSAPRAHWTGLFALVATVVVGCLIWGWKHRAGSVDMALHYALVEFIRDNWAWPTPAVMHMGEMNQYPPVSHTVAAIGGALTGSSFLGLHLVSTASVIAVYASLFVMLRFRSAQATLAAVAALVTVTLVFGFMRALLGREIVGNFFFPQLFGEMCVFALVLLRSRLAPGIQREICLAIAATFLLGWVYPIAAVQWAGIAVAWRVLRLWKTWQTSCRVGPVDLIWFAILLIGVLVAILLHPLFQFVTGLASNDGSIEFRIPGVMVVPAALLLGMVGLVLGWEFARGRLKLRAPDGFVALCGGIAGAALAQAAAFYLLGIGSRYGVYKHMFAVSTLLFASAIVCTIHFSRYDTAAASAPRRARQARLSFVPATLIALLACNVPWRGERLPSILRNESFLKAAMTQNTDIKSHAVLLGGGYIERFGFSMGNLGLSKERALVLIYESAGTPQERQAVVDNTPIKYAFVASNSVRDPACAIRADEASQLSLVSYPCQFRPASQ